MLPLLCLAVAVTAVFAENITVTTDVHRVDRDVQNSYAIPQRYGYSATENNQAGSSGFGSQKKATPQFASRMETESSPIHSQVLGTNATITMVQQEDGSSILLINPSSASNFHIHSGPHTINENDQSWTSTSGQSEWTSSQDDRGVMPLVPIASPEKIAPSSSFSAQATGSTQPIFHMHAGLHSANENSQSWTKNSAKEFGTEKTATIPFSGSFHPSSHVIPAFVQSIKPTGAFFDKDTTVDSTQRLQNFYKPAELLTEGISQDRTSGLRTPTNFGGAPKPIEAAANKPYVFDFLAPPVTNIAFLELVQNAVAGKTYPALTEIPENNFNCTHVKIAGYFANLETGCQVFHRCDTEGAKTDYLCPEQTIFNQVTLNCDWWFNVDCPNSAKFVTFANSRLHTALPLFDTPPKEYVPSWVPMYYAKLISERPTDKLLVKSVGF